MPAAIGEKTAEIRQEDIVYLDLMAADKGNMYSAIKDPHATGEG